MQIVSRYKERRGIPPEHPAGLILSDFWRQMGQTNVSILNHSGINRHASLYQGSRDGTSSNRYAVVSGGVIFLDETRYEAEKGTYPELIVDITVQTFVKNEQLTPRQKSNIEKDIKKTELLLQGEKA